MRIQLFAAILAVVVSPVAVADHGGHGSFRGHVAPAAVHGGVHGAAYSGHYYGGPRVYGARSYYGGPRFYGPRYYGRFGPRYYGVPYHHYYPGWYGPLVVGTFVATLPLYYDSFWWGGVRYYYYDDTYYRWNSDVSQYEVVTQPAGAPDTTNGSSSTSADLFVYPAHGQSEKQQQTDRYECHRWAADQTSYDPTQANGQDAAKRNDYLRAEGACLTGRGYSVK